MSYCIVSISNSGGAPEQAYRKMQSAGACPTRPFAEMFKLEVPSLSVGTLDTLMTLSDELGKIDSIMEGIVRKIEKTAAELVERRAGHGQQQHGGSSSSSGLMELTVGGVPAPRYIQQFAWDSAKYPSRRPLKELVALIAGGAASVEEELKQLSQSFADKYAALQDVKRRKGGNLLSGDLNDILTEDVMRNVKVVDTEYLKTIFIAVQKHMKEKFESTVYSLANDLVGFGGPDWSNDPTKLGEPVSFGPNIDRHKQRGSPVVPGSLHKIHADEEGILYSVTILKGQYESGYYENGEFQQGNKIDFVTGFTRACKEKQYIVRDNFEWDPTASTKNSMSLEQLQVEVDGMKSALTRWCKNHYGDAFVAWMHLKVIRVFVESVLRYGLPVDFTAVLYKVHPNKGSDLITALDKELSTTPPNAPKDDDDDGMMGDGDDEFHDFVLLKFDP